MKILIVTHYFEPHIGGIEVVAYNQAKELVKKGHEVAIITSKLNHERAVEQKAGIRIIRIPAWNVLEKKLNVPYPIFSPCLIPVLNREIQTSDIIHAHGLLYLGSFISAILAKLHKKPFFVTEHVGFVMYRNSILNIIEKLALNTLGLLTLRASKAAIVVNMSIQSWIKQYKKEVYILPNGVDFGLFNKPTDQEKQAIRERYNIPLDKFVVLFVGRFVPKKGFDVLYSAKDPSYLLIFVGGGMIPDYIKPDDSVRIMGPLPQEDLALIYKASDVFILPSCSEGFPLAIPEAMATGLPVITSKHNKLGQMFESSLITYVDRTETDIKSAIKKIQIDTMLRKDMSEFSNSVAREELGWENIIVNLIHIYYKTLECDAGREQ